MGEEHTVHAKLTLDDQATHVLEHIKEGFEHVGEEAHEVAGEMAGIFKSAVGTALGFELAGMVETFKSIGEEVWHAAAGMEDQEKGIRGVLMMIDKEGASLEEMTKESHELNEEFAQMGVATGSSKEVLIGAFEEMSERTSMAREEVKNLTGEMAQAGRAVQGGPGALASGFSMMSMGIIRARNPIVQLIKATGTLHGTAKEVAKQLTLMGPEQAMKAGIAAIGKMSAKMKDVPLSFNETIASMKALREQIYEALGTPVLKALTGPLTQLREYFTKHREEINKWAEEVGHDVGEGLTVVADKIKEGFQYLQAHSKEIKEDIVAAMNIVKETVQFLIDHRTAIALAWGVPKLVGGAFSAAGATVGLGEKALGFGARMAGTTVSGEAAGGAIGAGASVAALGALAAAIAGVAAAAWQAKKLYDETTSDTDQAAAYLRQMEQAAAEGHADFANVLRDEIIVLDASKIALVNALAEIAKQNEQVNAIESKDDSLMLAAEESSAAAENGKRSANWAVTQFMAGLDSAVQRHDQASLTHMAEFIKTHDNILDAMHTAGVDLTKEGKFLVGALESLPGGHMKAEEVRGIMEKQIKEQKAANNVMNFNGAITIHQDFKNVDPDRIAIIFKKALAGSAHAKPMAATNVPHTDF